LSLLRLPVPPLRDWSRTDCIVAFCSTFCLPFATKFGVRQRRVVSLSKQISVQYRSAYSSSRGAQSVASRGVITLHAGQTMSVIDSGQGGPAFFFSSQLGSWKPNGTGGVVARTIDFDFPPGADVARLDYSISFAQEHTQVTGTITLTTFPLQGNPLDGGATVVGNFIFTGQLINP
jgi:hypothetical protein